MSPNDPRRPDLPLAIVLAVFLGLHLLPLFGPTLGLWGTDLLADVPGWAQGAFAAASALVVLAAVSPLGAGPKRSLPAALDPWGGRRSARAFTALLVVLGTALFVAFPSATRLFGDGQLVARILDDSMSLAGWQNDNAPLSYVIARALARLPGAGAGGAGGEGVYRLLSVAAGIGTLALSVPVARRIGEDRSGRWIALGFLLTAGTLPLFFGYVETYPLVLFAELAVLAAGLRAPRGRRFPWAATVALGVAIPIHFSLATLVPAVAILGGAAGEGPSRPGRVVSALGSAALSVTVAIGILTALGYEWSALGGGPPGRHLLPVGGEPGFVHPYGMFDPAHDRDLLSQLLLVAPAAILALFLFRRRPGSRHPAEPFLAAATAGSFLFVAVANPEIGAFRDWDVFAFPALPALLWAATRFAVGDPGEARRRRRAALVLAAAGLHAALWIGVNANAEASERRFARLLATARLSAHARSYGWECLGARARDTGRLDFAARCYERATEADPDNPRHWNSAGMLLFESGDPEAALARFRHAVTLDPGFPTSHYNLGFAHVRLGEDRLAAESFRAALARDPGSGRARYQLAGALARLGELERAVAEYEIVLRSAPDHPDAHFELGMTCGRLGRWEAAARHLERAAALGADRPWGGEARARALDARTRAAP